MTTTEPNGNIHSGATGRYETRAAKEAVGVSLTGSGALASKSGLPLEVGDPVSIGSGTQRWNVTGLIDAQTVQLTYDDGRSRKAKAATLLVDRPRADMPNGKYNAHPKDEALVVDLIAKWRDRDPEYTAQLEQTLEDLPFWGVGSYDTARIKELVPQALWTRVAQSKQTTLYLSLREPHNGWTHEDALIAAEGHGTLPGRRPQRAELEAMSDADLHEAVLVWGIRNDDDSRLLTRAVRDARAA